jgi:O-antigen/teichoic acid export membrane protein
MLSPTDLGKYSYYLSLLTVILSVMSLTIYGAYLRFLGFVNTKKLIRFAKLVLIIATIGYSIVVIILWKKLAFIPLLGIIWFNEELYFFRSLSRIRLYTMMKFTRRVLVILLLLLFFIIDSINFEKMIFLTGLTYLTTYLVFRFFRSESDVHIIQKESFKRKDILKYSMPGAVSVLSLYFLASADQVFINSYLTPLDLSNYAMALRTLAVIKLFSAVFMDYWPRFYYEKAKEKSHVEIKKMGLLFKVSIIAFSVFCIAVASPIYILLGAKAYIGQSTLIFSVLVFSEIFRVFGSINMTFRSFTKESIYNVTILGLLGLMKIGVNFLFIEKYGLTILLLSTITSYILYWLISIFVSVRAEKLYMSV